MCFMMQVAVLQFYLFFFFNAGSQTICERPDHLVMLILIALEICHCFKSQEKPQTITGKNAQLFPSLSGYER